MRVFVAGAWGAIGKPLTTKLLAAGHEVVGTTRSHERAQAIRAAGAAPVVIDAFDADALARAVADAEPEVVVNQLTDLSAPLNPRKYGQWLATTNRLREHVTPVLAGAARDAGARRLISQSVSFMQRPEGPPVLDEDAPLATELGAPVGSMQALERTTLTTDGIDGVVLRYGYFYGPGTMYAPGGSMIADLRRRRMPVLGPGGALWSFIHVDDAADATIAALDGPAGTYNVVDDEPAPQRVWVRELARVAGAPRPLRVPLWLARLVVGPLANQYGAAMRGASNARAKERLRWAPAHPSWRAGFAELFADTAAAP